MVRWVLLKTFLEKRVKRSIRFIEILNSWIEINVTKMHGGEKNELNLNFNRPLFPGRSINTHTRPCIRFASKTISNSFFYYLGPLFGLTRNLE